MAGYELTWITNNLAVGHAPMSYPELDSLREQGIDAILNLCGEFCDLHEIEQKHGFEVHYLPVADEEAPRLEELETALNWLDEAIYLGKKVLVHCRFGIGRTGTVITSYLLRRGFGHKLAKSKLKSFRSAPSSFAQWWLLRKYGRKSGRLTIREPSLEGDHLVDLSSYFEAYENLLAAAGAAFDVCAANSSRLQSCGRGTDACCHSGIYLQFIEAAYLHYHLNRSLSGEERLAAISRAVKAGAAVADVPEAAGKGWLKSSSDRRDVPGGQDYTCPLSVDKQCIVYRYRPLACRLYGVPLTAGGRFRHWEHKTGQKRSEQSLFRLEQANEVLQDISLSLFCDLHSIFLEDRNLLFPLTDVVSGKFIEDYFTFLMRLENDPNGFASPTGTPSEC